jgi:hypothetical protein
VDHSLSSAAARPANQSKPGLLEEIQDKTRRAKDTDSASLVSSAATAEARSSRGSAGSLNSINLNPCVTHPICVS